MKHKRLLSVAIGLLVVVSLWSPRPAQAVNLWGDWFDRTVGQKGFNDVGFGRTDPRTIIANVLNIALGLLGVLAVVLIMYAGFVWMTASGNPERIEIAKKILTSAAIGLLIVLSSWAIAIYVLSRLWLATGTQGVSPGMFCSPEGATTACGCGGVRTCTNKQWGGCAGSDCSGGGRKSCDANPLTQVCDADNTACPANQYCNPKDCFCAKRGGYGDSCNQDATGKTCQADNTVCQQYLTCDPAQCACLGAPVITSISPMGGFCNGSPDTVCASDADCSAFKPATCNLNAPNGAAGNLATINGQYFLNYDAKTSKVMFWDGSGFNIPAQLATNINPACSESWTDSQIIVVVPAGAKNGAVQVVAGNGADSTNDNRGPAISDFVINNLKRPGLCNLNPIFGNADALLTYSGTGLAQTSAYFGSARQNVPANNSAFNANDTGTAKAPNLVPGLTTTFVMTAKGPMSNYLQYTQQAAAAQAPIIVSFTPTSSPAGQYVTILGSGFGNIQKDSHVYFGIAEADYSFPPVCAQSVWRDSEIIVKVPKGLADGNYKLAVVVNKLRGEATATFKVDKKLPLLPGLCKIDPLFGQINDNISFWGEYFGPFSLNSRIGFSPNLFRQTGPKICLGGVKDGQTCALPADCDSGNCQAEITYWGADPSVQGNNRSDLASTKVPSGAITGPVFVGKGNQLSNTINFTVGSCNQDSQCGGTNVCCPAGTPAAGRCKGSSAECYGSTDSCVFEWDFNTGGQNKCTPDKPNACQDGSCCRSACVLSSSGLTTCLDNLSCAGYGSNQCLDSLMCPNSPGNCSFNKQVVTTGSSCNCNLLACPNCQFSDTLNRCVSPQTCSLQDKVTVDNRQWDRYCATFNGAAHWQVNTNQTCPTGFTPIATGSRTCVDLKSSCNLCPPNLVCGDNKNGGAQCMTPQPICPNNFTCQNQVCTRKEGTCECCCDKSKNNADKTNSACCSPLTCDNSCGAGGNFGYCSGCANIGSTQDEHDAACNCTGTTGKYCDTSLAGGACRDCSQIGDPASCSGHAACCVNAKQGNACVGLIDSKFLQDDISYCAFYNCGDNCTAPAKTGTYDTLASCQNKCGLSCNDSIQPGVCLPNASKCPKDKICNNQCQCVPSNSGPEKSCVTPAGSCSPLLCSQAYGCFSDLGAANPSQSSCLCCCDPTKTGANPLASDFDKCKAIGNGSLFCQKNMGSCSGNQRGLCCGCKADSDCGDINSTGCGADTCCHNRPSVEKVLPIQDSTGICRNALIRAVFDRKMDIASFNSNIIVVGDFGDNLCPDNSTLLAAANLPQEQETFLAKLWRQFADLLAKLFPFWQPKIVAAAGNHNFCAFTGKVVGGATFDLATEKTYADFQLSSALAPNIKYYVIVKGDDGSNTKSGVLDFNKIGLHGVDKSDTSTFNGLAYLGAYIWSFTTSGDICYVDHINITPPQHLFQKPQTDYPFYADAVAKNGNVITSLPIYGWAWSWRSDNSAVASVQPQDFQATVTSGSKRSDETFVYARATIISDLVSPLSTAGSYKEGRAKIIVFICDNPWPPVINPDAWPIRWQDKGDNCTVFADPAKPVPADCLNNNFEFYYCRDKGSAGTKNNYPSLTLTPPIRARYQYQSNNAWVDVLKDFYFFRINLPDTPTGLQAALTDNKQGGEVKLTWPTARDLTYKIYYGTAPGVYSNEVDAGTKDNILIPGLENSQDYYFALTATNLQQAESDYSDEVKIRVEDKIAPDKPAGVVGKVIVTANDKQVNLVWSANPAETLKYNIGYGPSATPAVTVTAGSVTQYTIKKLTNLGVQDYYIELTALDAYNNQSSVVTVICSKGCTAQNSPCACVIQQ